jgi:hypothetical protein
VILQDWSGYRTKSDYVLKCLADEGRGLAQQTWGNGYEPKPIPRDGEWFQLGRAYNVGGKLLFWMVENGFLERRKSGKSVEVLLGDWYRVTEPADAADLGDWWIE